MRRCPGCQSTMQTLESGGVEIDRCLFCGGIHLDEGELEQVAGHPRDAWVQDLLTALELLATILTS